VFITTRPFIKNPKTRLHNLRRLAARSRRQAVPHGNPKTHCKTHELLGDLEGPPGGFWKISKNPELRVYSEENM